MRGREALRLVVRAELVKGLVVGMESALFSGSLRHRRFLPVFHEFRYPLTLLYLDLSELDVVFRDRWFWSAGDSEGDANLAWFRRSDHFGPRTQPLDETVRDFVESSTGERPTGPIRLLTQPRSFGYVFNPISVFYCFSATTGEVETIVAEVSNTPWNQRHCYVLGKPGLPWESEHRFRKEFHVSPFMQLDQEYLWRSRTPGEHLSIHMESFEQNERMFDATLTLTRREIDTASLHQALFLEPLQAARVMVAIHWQAVKLWWKGVAYVPHPATIGGPPVGQGNNGAIASSRE
jgi:DUF1365 family protein